MTNRDRVMEIIYGPWQSSPGKTYQDWIFDRIAAEGLIAPEWVSVEDRLPEIGQDVLIWCGWRMTGIWNGKEWTDEQRVSPVFHVTHWQPLPPPPKADTVQEPDIGPLPTDDQVRLYMKSGGTKDGAEKIRAKLTAEEKRNA